MNDTPPHPPTAPVVTFWGAAQSVTGSMHFVEAGPTRLLLDCGLHRGPRDEARRRNRDFPFDPTSLTAVVLSHAHVDHCGNLANLVRQGFAGPIFCTPATRELMAVMLADSARIHEEEAQVEGSIHGPRSDRSPLFTRKDVSQTIAQAVAVPYGETGVIDDRTAVRFLDAGHILGSAVVALTLRVGGRDWRVTFTGDLGRRGLPFLRQPTSVPAADLVICESTYGGRFHDTMEGMAAKMADVVTRTVARGGKGLIPAFSLGRTQLVVHYLRRWMRDGLLPPVPLYVDSPLASVIAGVYDRHPDALEASGSEGAPPVEYLTTAEEALRHSTQRDPCIIVASGGMCEGGRIVQHLRLHVDDPRSSIVLVSYQAPDSVGAKLLEMRPTVRFHGRSWNKWVEVLAVNGFSGHADQNDFLALLGDAAHQTGKVRLVHGEPDQAAALAERLRKHGFPDVGVPRREERVSVA